MFFLGPCRLWRLMDFFFTIVYFFHCYHKFLPLHLNRTKVVYSFAVFARCDSRCIFSMWFFDVLLRDIDVILRFCRLSLSSFCVRCVCSKSVCLNISYFSFLFSEGLCFLVVYDIFVYLFNVFALIQLGESSISLLFLIIRDLSTL